MSCMTRNPELTTRALKRTAVFLVVLAAIIIVPAWSWHYWQGWLYWIVFSACTLSSGAYFLRHSPALVARRMSAGPTAETRSAQKVIQTFVSVFMTLTFLFPALDYHFGWSSLPPWVAIAGDVFVVVGYGIMVLALNENSHAASTVVVEENQPVVSSGPYGIVRHPMYSGALVMLLATPIALGSLWGLVFAAASVGGLIWRLLDEEGFLRDRLPGYADYCRRNRHRLIPWLW